MFYALFLWYIHILGAQQNCFSIFAGWPRGGQVLGKAIEFAFGVSYTLGALQSSGSERRTKIELYWFMMEVYPTEWVCICVCGGRRCSACVCSENFVLQCKKYTNHRARQGWGRDWGRMCGGLFKFQWSMECSTAAPSMVTTCGWLARKGRAGQGRQTDGLEMRN